MQRRSVLRAALLSSAALAAAIQTEAAVFTNDFNLGITPPGTTVHGSTVVEATGGVDNSGVLKITKAVNSQSGAFIIEDLDAGAAIYGFDARFKARIGGGSATPADGFSFVFAPDIPDGAFGEEGVGAGITIAFDIYDNDGGEAPALDVKVGGAVVASTRLSIAEISTGNEFADVRVTLSPAGILNLSYKGNPIYSNFVLPNYQPISGRFAFGGRTGGLNANQWIDNLGITTFLLPESAFALQPRSQTVRLGANATFTAQVTNPDGVTFQWLKNGVPIVGATDATLTVSNPTVADSGATYRVVATGPNNVITSGDATLTVVDIPLPPTPAVSIDFNDGGFPVEGEVRGSAFVEISGGVNDTGVMKLTIAENDQAGAFILNGIGGGAEVFGLTASFHALVGGGTEVPADGFSFSFTPSVPDPLPGELEEGVGAGLRVTFDIYDNGGGEAPSVDIKSGATVVASVKLPISAIRTQDQFVPVIIRLQNDGTVDVVYNGEIIHNNVAVPGMTGVANGSVVLAARTGGLNENFWIDNLQLTPDLTSGALRIVSQPVAATVLVGKSASFSAAVNDPVGTTYQWTRNGVAIGGATSATLNIPAVTAADLGATYRLEATKGGTTVTSEGAVLTVVNLTAPTVPTLSFNFDNGQTPVGATNTGSSVVDLFGGVGDSGVVKLTLAENDRSGAFVIDPLLSGAEVSELTAAFDLYIGGGSAVPADGMSFNFAPGLQNTPVGGAEDGVGNGLTIAFDTYNNGATELTPAPSVDVKYKGQIVATKALSIPEITTGEGFIKVIIKVSADGKLDMSYGDRVLFHQVQLPNYTFTANGKFGFYARTGGLNANHWVDNLQIEAIKSVLPLRITAEPASVSVISGLAATFSVGVSDPIGATYQWLRNGAPITGATSATFTTAATTAGDNNAVYSVRVTGPGGTVTSANATLRVVPAITITSPIGSFNFDDGGVPAEATINGTTYLDAGVVKLTDAVNGQQGSIIIADLNSGASVNAFTVKFKLLIGGGTATPADGFGFVWASDLDLFASFGEDGSGTGLIVSFDTYDNAGGEAPAIDVRWAGSEVATRKLPLASVQSGADVFADVIIRVEADGTLDLQYKNQVIYDNLQIPGFTAQAGANFGFGGRTGGLNDNHWVDDIQIATVVGATAPQITAIRAVAGGNITIEWSGGGTLQARDSLSAGAWADVGAATSPHTVSASAGMRFFRVRQ